MTRCASAAASQSPRRPELWIGQRERPDLTGEMPALCVTTLTGLELPSAVVSTPKLLCTNFSVIATGRMRVPIFFAGYRIAHAGARRRQRRSGQAINADFAGAGNRRDPTMVRADKVA
jgi:hypothetical protein